MSWNDDLQAEDPAYQIASSGHQRIRVLAGPGTGKSFAMKRRIARLLEEENVEPRSILAVTFTRVAAEDLHRELMTLNVPGAGLLSGKTLHGLAMSILMRNHVLAVLGRHPRPLNDFEIEPLLADLSNAHGNKRERRKLIRAYGAAWARLQADEPGIVLALADLAFADDLVAWLKVHEAMLMDEIIPHLLRYLRDNPGAPEFGEFSHLLIDEYQDLNRAEQEVLELLGRNASTCIVGDDDQSIYGFKHAHPDGIRLWSTNNPTAEHVIAECWRCPVTVVRMANALIRHNTNRLGNEMQERHENGPGEIVVRQYQTVDDEANAVTNKISLLIASGVAPGEIIVLAQRRPFAISIFRLLHAKNIPAKSYYAETALDSVQAQERFALLKLFLNNEDKVALRWLLGCQHDHWQSKSYRRILSYVRQHGLSPWQTLHGLLSGAITIAQTNSLCERFRVINDEIANLASIDNLDEFIQHWLPIADETQLLADTVAIVKPACTTAREMYEKLQEAISQPDIPAEVVEVRIMSLHKSKGLSACHVFIVGCVDGLLPTREDTHASPQMRLAKLEEDRRLFYVGITRVKAKLPDRPGYLALTYPQTMLVADAYSNQITPAQTRRGVAYLHPSRFFDEMRPHVPPAEYNIDL